MPFSYCLILSTNWGRYCCDNKWTHKFCSLCRKFRESINFTFSIPIVFIRPRERCISTLNSLPSGPSRAVSHGDNKHLQEGDSNSRIYCLRQTFQLDAINIEMSAFGLNKKQRSTVLHTSGDVIYMRHSFIVLWCLLSIYSRWLSGVYQET